MMGAVPSRCRVTRPGWGCTVTNAPPAGLLASWSRSSLPQQHVAPSPPAPAAHLLVLRARALVAVYGRHEAAPQRRQPLLVVVVFQVVGGQLLDVQLPLPHLAGAGVWWCGVVTLCTKAAGPRRSRDVRRDRASRAPRSVTRSSTRGCPADVPDLLACTPASSLLSRSIARAGRPLPDFFIIRRFLNRPSPPPAAAACGALQREAPRAERVPGGHDL